MSVNHLLLLHIFLLTFKTGFSDVFVQTGASVQLDIQTQELPNIHVLTWGKDKSTTIVTFITATNQAIRDSAYEERVEFNTETFSLTLKNMQKTDSGLYTARAIEDNNKFFAEYRVSVIDAVEAPVLTVSSNQSSSNSCTVNFTCKSHNLTLNSTYNSGSCSQKEVPSDGINTLILNCSQKSIICNHRNPISWKEDKINIKELCVNQEKTPEKRKQSESSHLWLVGVGVVVLVTVVILVLVIHNLKCKKGAQQKEQTIYAEVDENIKPQKSLEMLEKSDNPQTVYDTAGDPGQTDVTIHTTPNDNPMNQSSSLTEKSKPDAPVTIYCAIQKQPKLPKTEAENTIYAVVNKPSAGYECAHPQPE